MLTKDDFIRHILGEAPRAKARAAKKNTGHIEGFDFADDAPDSATEDTRFVTPLLQAGFGDGQGIPRATVIRSSDAVAKYIPDEVRYWPKTPTRPHHTLLIEANLTHRELLAIPAFKSRQLAHLDIAEDAVARLVAEALEGFQRGADGLDASALKGQKHETLCVVSIIDERENHAGRLACFGTFNAKTEGLETFFLTEHARTWDRADARERLGFIYERQFKKLGEASWQEAFTTTDERKQAENLLEVCTKKNVSEKDLQESILDLLDTIARGFGLRKKADAERRLRAFPLPGEHDIGIDSEEREKEYGGTNPFSGVTLRDDHSRLLGYIVYPLKTKSQAEKLRQHLEKHNRFHNVLVVYPDANQARIELWQGREQLTGKLRKGQSHKDAADVVNLLSRFFVVSKAKVRNPAELAQELAYRARYLRRLALRQLEDEPEKGPLRNLYNAFKVALVHDQKEDEFADAFAQTITYGLLTARWLGNDQLAATGDRFTRQSARKYLPAASPFLNDLFKSALSLKLDEQRGRLLWLVDDVADLLDRIDVTYVFGAGDKGSDTATDPVIHFYEPFLAAYDKNLKNKRGVFFTPRPVVSYIVRSVHELLQNEFGIEDGLASTDTWADVAKRIDGLKLPEGTMSSDPFVCILDPATGTGTFLYECIEVIERTLKERWCRELGTQSWADERVMARWSDYVRRHLLPRLYGYELMMASFAVAHLKLSFKLGQTGYQFATGDHLHVYLTNSLEPPSSSANPRVADLFATLAREAQEVGTIKLNRRFSVVVGNPPYAGHSVNNQVEWIVDKVYDYKRGLPELQKPGQAKWLQDDYVKFIRLAEHILEQVPAGILGFITNHSFLDNPTFKGMRRHLIERFARISAIDLHGNSKKKERAADGTPDENVFEIQQGVAITLARRGVGPAHVEHVDLLGSRESKYAWLASNTIQRSAPNEISPRPDLFLFRKQDLTLADEYGSYIALDKCMSENGDPAPGIVTTHDEFAISWSRSEAAEKIEFLLATKSEAEARKRFTLCSQNQWNYSRAKAALADGLWRKQVVRILYRPFDWRWTIFNSHVAVHRRERVMRHMLGGKNIGLICTRQTKDQWGVFVTRDICAHKTCGAYDINFLFPLNLHPDPDELKLGNPGLRPNLSKTALEAFRSASGNGDPERIFEYFYGLFHSPEFRNRYSEFLKSNFPRVPIPRSRELFDSIAGLGRNLIELHLLERKPANNVGRYNGTPSPEVEKASWVDEVIWLDTKKASGFINVPRAVWSFHVGGYQVCEKWLKDRKGRKLSKTDIDTYQRIVGALSETLRLMAEVDVAVGEHGGWPGAFVTKASAL